MANKKDVARARAGDKNLRGSNLSGADLQSIDLMDVDLREADLTGAELWGTNFGKSDLSNASLSGADLNETYLAGANLSGADLTGADLGDADLTGADLTGANLTAAVLTGAILRGADLTGAIVSRAFFGADLTDANVSGVDFSRTHGIRGVRKNPAKRAARSNPSPGKTAAQVTSRATRRILADIKNNVLPYDIESFSELHDYVDGNAYLLDDNGHQDASMATLRKAVEEIEGWLMNYHFQMQGDTSWGRRGFSKKPAEVRRGEGLRDLRSTMPQKSGRGYGVRR